MVQILEVTKYNGVFRPMMVMLSLMKIDQVSEMSGEDTHTDRQTGMTNVPAFPCKIRKLAKNAVLLQRRIQQGVIYPIVTILTNVRSFRNYLCL
jgi:hypothetical protein